MVKEKRIEPDIALAATLFSELAEATHDTEGFTRPSYSDAENTAHELVRARAVALGLCTSIDEAGNLYMRLEGSDSEAQPYIIGSHLDSVRCGGNFDGAAGVLAGLAIAGGYRRSGYKPPRDVVVMAIRAEESMWFSCAYIGSRAALGCLDAGTIDTIRRVDTGRSLREHAAECGFKIERMCGCKPKLHAGNVAAFLEVHIEQGPVLEQQNIPVGIVSGVRGNFRYRSARCSGEYGHCGTVPRALRRDAVCAVADLIGALDWTWDEYEKKGNDLAITFGIVQTDGQQHSISKIPGKVAFALDVRSLSPEVLIEMGRVLDEATRQIQVKRGVMFDLGKRSDARPALMDKATYNALVSAAGRADIPHMSLPSGAGHDSAMFAQAGIPAGMVFIRNSGGSHNPREWMQMADFALACSVVVEMIEADRLSANL